jgi:hypothetical protein
MLGPNALQDVHILAGARVAFILVEPVAVAMLVHIVTTTDHVNGGASGGDLVERGELAGRDGGCDEAWTMRHKEADAVGVRGGTGGDQEAVGCVRVVADQQPIEAAGLGGLGEVTDVTAIHHKAGGRMYF